MTKANPKRAIADIPSVESRILTIRGRRVILDADLAALYGVSTKAFNQAVKRNGDRFPPDDFMFVLTKAEKREVVTNCDHLARLKFSSALPRAFTEHGAIMAASVLNSPRAVEMSVYVVRAFVKMREALAATAELSRRLEAVEHRIDQHDDSIRALVAAVRQLMAPVPTAKRKIGFQKETP